MTPLTAEQQKAIAQIVTRMRLRIVPPDLAKAANFLQHSRETLAELLNVATAHVRHAMAYDAAHDVGEAMLAAYGYRTGSGPGQHASVGEFLVIIFENTSASVAAERYDQFRQVRNDLRYQAKSIGSSQADFAVDIAQKLLEQADMTLA